jgi:hypothetical protein
MLENPEQAGKRFLRAGAAALGFNGPTLGKGGTLHVEITRLRPGYPRKNGVPYSANATLTEYFDKFERNGESYLIVTAVVIDPEYLSDKFIVSSQYRLEKDGSKWNPSPCRPLWPKMTESPKGGH